MADQSDVEAELARVIAEALYPDGVAADSAIGAVCRVYRGVPVPGRWRMIWRRGSRT